MFRSQVPGVPEEDYLEKQPSELFHEIGTQVSSF